MNMIEPNGSAGWADAVPMSPAAPAALISAELIAQMANELYSEMPNSRAAVAGSENAPAAALRGDEAPLATVTAATPATPGADGAPTPDGVFPTIPDLGLARVSADPTAPTSGRIPSVGEGEFLGNIPFELGFPALFDAGTATGSQNEGELLEAVLQLSPGNGAPSPTATGAHFYFLPVLEMPTVTPEPHGVFDVQTVRRDFPALHQQVHGKPLIWLDNAATTQKPQCVIDTLAHYYAHDNSNIHRGAHTLAARATDAYEEARQKVQRFLGAGSPAEIIFTRGTTEAINLVTQTYGRKFIGPGDEVVVTTLEHHSNIVPWQLLCQQTGAVLRVIPIDEQGQVLLDAYEKLLNSHTRMVAITQVSNVLGTVLPVSLMAQMAHRHGAKVLVDGAQGVPHLPVNVQALDADFYAFSGHKLFAPTGIGILYGKQELLDAMPPWQGGGSMIESVSFEHTNFNPPPAKFEAGTPAIAGAIGLGTAIDYVNRYGMESIAAYEEGLMAYALAALSTIPGLQHLGTTPGKVGALAFVMPGIRSEELGAFLDREGIAVRAGHHCAQPALARYGLTAAVRPSISLYNTPQEIDALVAALHKAQGVMSAL